MKRKIRNPILTPLSFAANWIIAWLNQLLTRRRRLTSTREEPMPSDWQMPASLVLPTAADLGQMSPAERLTLNEQIEAYLATIRRLHCC